MRIRLRLIAVRIIQAEGIRNVERKMRKLEAIYVWSLHICRSLKANISATYIIRKNCTLGFESISLDSKAFVY